MAIIDNQQAMAEVGEGNLNWPGILAACQEIEVEWRPRVNVHVSTVRLTDTVKVMQLIRAELERLVHNEAIQRGSRGRSRT